MISNLGWIIIVIILVEISSAISNEDDCYKRDPYVCERCKKNCKWHDISKKFLIKIIN